MIMLSLFSLPLTILWLNLNKAAYELRAAKKRGLHALQELNLEVFTALKNKVLKAFGIKEWDIPI